MVPEGCRVMERICMIERDFKEERGLLKSGPLPE